MSLQIRKLEDSLGTALFTRTTRRTMLTPAGAAFVETTRRCLMELDRGAGDLRLRGEGIIGHIAVGYVSIALLVGLSEAIESFRASYPQVRLTLREISSAPQLRLLRDGGLDVAITSGVPIDPSIVLQACWKDRLIAVVGQDHPLVQRGSGKASRGIQLRALSEESFVMFPPGESPSHHREIVDACRAAGFVPRIVQESESWHSVVSLVAAGLGVTIAPAAVLKLRVKGARWRPIAGRRLVTHLSLFTRSGASPTVAAFVAAARRKITTMIRTGVGQRITSEQPDRDQPDRD